MNITRNRTPGAESLYGNTTNDKLKLPFGKRLSARTGALALAASLGGFGAGWAAHDHFDSQSQAPDKTVEQANAATVVPTPEITASKEPSPADLEPLEAVVPEKSDYEKAREYRNSEKRIDTLNDVMNRAAEAIVKKCETDECFAYYPEAGYSYDLSQPPTDMWGILQHTPSEEGSSNDMYGAEVYFGSDGEVDLSKGVRGVFATTGFDTGVLYGGSIQVGRGDDDVLWTQETNFLTLGDNGYRFSDTEYNVETIGEIDRNVVDCIQQQLLDMPKE